MGKRVSELKWVLIGGLAGFAAFSGNHEAYPASLQSFAPPSEICNLEHAKRVELVAVSDDAAGIKNAGALPAGAQTFVDSMAQRALGFLANSSMSHEQKKQNFSKLLQDSFDMNTIGRFTLGRYWRVSTKQQREEFLRLFRNMVIDVYSSRFSEYSGQRFETRSARQDGEKDAIVTSFLVPADGPEVQVDWRVRFKDGRYRIVDVIVEGVSMSVTQRSDFSSVIQRGGGDVQVLLAYLKQQ